MTRTGRRIGLGLIITALLIAMVVAFVKIGKIEKTKDLILTDYSIGTLSAEDGAETKSDHAIRSKFLKADKFNKISLSEKADVTYQIYYFNADKEFIGKSAELSAETTELEATFTVDAATEKVKYFRVLIIVPEAKDEVTILNMNDYVKQITVTLNK